jgi:hypothetical protein
MTTAPSNQLFSFSRWRLLVAKHWVEHRRPYLLSLLAIAGLYAAWFAFVMAIDTIAPMEVFMQFAAYIFGLCVVGCLYASMLFSDLSTKKDALPWLSLPASQLEKLLCALFYGVVLFYVAYTLVFYLVDIIMVQWSNNLTYHHPRYFPGSTIRVMPVRLYNLFTAVGAPVPEREHHLFISLFFAIQAAFILGSVYFTRYSFIKTAIAVLLFSLGFIVLQRGVIHPLLPRGWFNDPLGWARPLYDGGPMIEEVRLPGSLETTILRISQLGLPLFFWFVTYIRLKEKEV